MFPLLFLPIVGLMIDAGIMFDARRDLQNMADGAARVGGMELDERYLRGFRPGDRNMRGFVQLDTDEAERAANEYLNRMDFPRGESRDVHAEHEYIRVSLYRDVPTSFLRLVRIQSFRIHSNGRAEPCAAVSGDDCLPNQ